MIRPHKKRRAGLQSHQSRFDPWLCRKQGDRRKSEQGPEIRANRKIQSLSQNIVVTDYLHFIWINKDGVQRETLCHPADLEDRKFRLREDRADAVRKLLQAF